MCTSSAHSPWDASSVLLGALVSLPVEKASLGEAVEKQRQPTVAGRNTVITVAFREGSPAFGAIKSIIGNVSAEKAKVGSV